VLQPPASLLLPAGKSLGACPVHLKLLGSGFNEPLDDFWGTIYHHCQVDVNKVYPVQTIVDEQVVRAYYNAGLLVVRPERGLLRAWRTNFEALYRRPEYDKYYRMSEMYAIFMHQIVLAASILSSLRPQDYQQLPFGMNYPLHLHSQVDERRRPESLNQLITCRYEDFKEVFCKPRLDSLIRVESPFKEWLQDQGYT
jgi:hypothetical protein